MAKKEYSNVGIFFIPDYVVNSMKRAGVSLEKLALVVNDHDNQLRDVRDVVSKALRENISTKDIIDTYSCNQMFTQYIFDAPGYSCWNNIGNTGKLIDLLRENFNGYGLDVDVRNELINLYSNKNIDATSILMSGNMKNELYTIETYSDMVYCIIHDGFVNPLVGNDNEFKKQFSIRLMDYMFRRLGEYETTTSIVFRRFMRLQK